MCLIPASLFDLKAILMITKSDFYLVGLLVNNSIHCHEKKKKIIRFCHCAKNDVNSTEKKNKNIFTFLLSFKSFHFNVNWWENKIYSFFLHNNTATHTEHSIQTSIYYNILSRVCLVHFFHPIDSSYQQVVLELVLIQYIRKWVACVWVGKNRLILCTQYINFYFDGRNGSDFILYIILMF